MKILINGYSNLLPAERSHNYGGPQNYAQTFIDYISGQEEHSFVGVIIHANKLYQKKFHTKIIRERRNFWVVIETFLDIARFLHVKKAIIPNTAKAKINQIVKVLQGFSPDLVFLNGFSVSNWYLLKAAQRLNIPVVSVHHGLWFKDIEAYGNVSPSAIKLTREMEKEITKISTKEIFLSKFSKQIYEENLIKTRKGSVEYIPLPYNTVFTNRSLPARPKHKILKIGFVGRWDPIKNHEAFLRLSQEAKQQGLNWQFYSVTMITKAKSLQSITEKYKKYIKVIPQMQASQLKKFYQSMNLLVLPSKFDVSPTVVMESLLQNRGVIISPNTGWTSLYKKFKINLWIDDFKDAKKTIKKIKILAKAPLPKKLISYLAKNHHPRAVMNKYFELFKSLKEKQNL